MKAGNAMAEQGIPLAPPRKLQAVVPATLVKQCPKRPKRCQALACSLFDSTSALANVRVFQSALFNGLQAHVRFY
jgi:hypothetical protein